MPTTSLSMLRRQAASGAYEQSTLCMYFLTASHSHNALERVAGSENETFSLNKIAWKYVYRPPKILAKLSQQNLPLFRRVGDSSTCPAVCVYCATSGPLRNIALLYMPRGKASLFHRCLSLAAHPRISLLAKVTISHYNRRRSR